MPTQPTIYRVARGNEAETVTCEQVWTQDGVEPLAAASAHIVPLEVLDQSYLIAIDQAGKASWYRLSDCDPWLARVAAAPMDLRQPWDVVEPFVLGNNPYLLAYQAQSGEFSFFPIGEKLSALTPYEFRRPRAPGITTGFDVVKPIVVNGLVYVLAYSSQSGDVNAYSLTVTAIPAAGSPPGAPALLALPVWVHQWARDWTRFAFFQLGGGTFFLKTNTGKLNVNIDHVLDVPSQGTVEVGTYLELENALDLDIVRAFYLGGGDPYFLTYMQDGTTTLYRFHGDCQGWTKQLEASTVAGATHIVPAQAGEGTLLLFC